MTDTLISNYGINLSGFIKQKLFRIKQMKNFLLKIILLVFLLSTILFSQTSPLPNGIKTHDGFYLNIIAGGGIAHYNGELSIENYYGEINDEITYSGGMPITIRLQIGGTISDNLILYGVSGSTIMYNATREVNGEEDTGGLFSNNVVMSGFGPGLCYYLMPANVYLSGSIQLAVATDSYGVGTEGQPIGFGFNMGVGKEWWVGEQWSLGLGLDGFYCSASNNYLSVNSYSINLVFAVTYN